VFQGISNFHRGWQAPNRWRRLVEPLGPRLRIGGRWLWQHSFRALGALLVLVVICTTARQTPSPGNRSGEMPPHAGAVPPAPDAGDRSRQYTWLSRRARAAYMPLCDRIPSPAGFRRVEVAAGSFADWLRHLPAAATDRAVTNFRKKVVRSAGDARVAAVIELQPGAGNLLTAPAMLTRLRAEHAWATGKLPGLRFHFTSGHASAWGDWAAGRRPRVQGRAVQFEASAPADSSRESFCSYLETLFRYTTVYSLLDDTGPVGDGSIAAGDVFIVTGRRPRACMVLDVAAAETGETRILLGEGGQPAQTFHVITGPDGKPWLPAARDGSIALYGGETLRRKDLRRWRP
jgi:hypothetical protein